MMIDEELTRDYVQAYRSQYNEREVSKEKLVTAIKYLNTLSGGIAAHRKSESLMHAVEHIDSMPDPRLDVYGLPRDYSKEELRRLMVEESEYLSEDFNRVVEKFHKARGFLPSPDEFIEFHDDMKGIVYLEQKVADTEKKVEETQQKMKQEMEETTQLLRQALQQERQQSEQLQQRVRELELTPEGEFQRRIREMEEENREMEEENRRLRFLKLCKICLEEEIQMVFIPCGHTVSCQECAQRLTDEKDPSQRKCPVCRKNIGGKVRMFLA